MVCFNIAKSDGKILVSSLNLHEIKIEKLGDYNWDFEMIGDFTFGKHKQTTGMRFKKFELYESSIKNIDLAYHSADTIFIAYINNSNTAEVNKANRSE